MKLQAFIALVILIVIVSPNGYAFPNPCKTTQPAWTRVGNGQTLPTQEHGQDGDFLSSKMSGASQPDTKSVYAPEKSHSPSTVASPVGHSLIQPKLAWLEVGAKEAKKTAAASLATLLLTAILSWPATAAVSGGRLGGSFTEVPRPSPTPQSQSRSYYSPEYAQGFRRGFRSGYYTSPPRIMYGVPSPFSTPFGMSPFGSPFVSPYFDRYYANPFGYPRYHAYPRPFLGFEFRF